MVKVLSFYLKRNARTSHNTSEEASSHYAVSDPFNFNIATAIDPTFTQRRPDVHDETNRKQPAQPLSRSLPVDGKKFCNQNIFVPLSLTYTEVQGAVFVTLKLGLGLAWLCA